MKKLLVFLSILSTLILVWCYNKPVEEKTVTEVTQTTENQNIEKVKVTEVEEATEDDVNELQKQLLEQLDKEINQEETVQEVWTWSVN